MDVELKTVSICVARGFQLNNEDLASARVFPLQAKGKSEASIAFSSGDLVLSMKSLCALGVPSMNTLVLKIGGEKAAQLLFDRLCELSAEASGGLIPVNKAGAGSSVKSLKVRVKGVLYRVGSASYDQPWEAKDHTLMLPASQIVSHDGQLYAPRWLLSKTIHTRLLGSKSWPAGFRGACYPMRGALWSSVFEPLVQDIRRLVQAEEAAKAKALEKYRAQQAEAAERARQRMLIVDEEEKKRNLAAEKRSAKKQPLPEILVERVEWDTWITKGSGRYSRMEKVTSSEENCVLMFSKSRVYIKTNGGRVIAKARKCVRYGDELIQKTLTSPAVAADQDLHEVGRP